MISETKIDESFPIGQFIIKGFCTPYRLDHNANGGGLLIYVREGIPSKLVFSSSTFESIFIEVNIRKKKWLISYSYNPNRNLISNHLTLLSKDIDRYLSK